MGHIIPVHTHTHAHTHTDWSRAQNQSFCHLKGRKSKLWNKDRVDEWKAGGNVWIHNFNFSAPFCPSLRVHPHPHCRLSVEVKRGSKSIQYTFSHLNKRLYQITGNNLQAIPSFTTHYAWWLHVFIYIAENSFWTETVFKKAFFFFFWCVQKASRAKKSAAEISERWYFV